MPDLDRELELARGDLLSRIQVPPLDTVRARATRLRQHRRAVTGAAALVLAAVFTGLTSLSWPAPSGPAPMPAASAPGGSWHGSGLTVLALTDVPLDLPGDVYDVAFADSRTGYALSSQCAGRQCALGFASTRDGGRRWVAGSAPPVTDAAPDRLPQLHPLPGGVVAATAAETFFTATGTTWTATGAGQSATVDGVPAGGVLWSRPAPVCQLGQVGALTPSGVPVRLAHQPPLQPCEVAPAPAGNGAWWVAGRADGQPAVAVSRDRGASWTTTPLPAAGPEAWAQVVTHGPEVYATVVRAVSGGDDLSVIAVYRSVDGGKFERYASDLGTMSGQLVPLADGRLVGANGSWLVTKQGRLTAAGTGLPTVASIERSAGAWVAYDLFLSHWVAVSADGQTWQKLNLH